MLFSKHKKVRQIANGLVAQVKEHNAEHTFNMRKIEEATFSAADYTRKVRGRPFGKWQRSLLSGHNTRFIFSKAILRIKESFLLILFISNRYNIIESI